jgi:hypothetical protein
MAMTPVSRVGTRPLAAGLKALMVGLTACLAAACVDSLEMRPFDHSLGHLSSTDRIEVTASGTTVATITDSDRIRANVAFVERYRTGWINVWSGVASSRAVVFYAGGKVLNSFGVGPAGINDGSYLRRLSKEELGELAGLLGVPPPEVAPARR